MYILGLGFIIGTILGSFAKAIADRSLTKRSFRGRSYCVSCKKTLNWYDLFPIFSYVFLKGKCRYCRKEIGSEYLLVEVITGILVGLLFYLQASNFQSFDSLWSLRTSFQFSIFILDLIFKTFFITILAVLFITDIRKMFIPDRVVIPAIGITLIYMVANTIYKVGYLYYYLSQSSLGKLLLPPHSDYFQRHAQITTQPLIGGVLMGMAIGGFFWALIIITKGKGMGGGDVKLGALMGLALGFPNSILALMIAFLSGAIISIILILFKRKGLKSVVPFGPFLVLGSLVALFWGNNIVDWYLKLSI